MFWRVKNEEEDAVTCVARLNKPFDRKMKNRAEPNAY